MTRTLTEPDIAAVAAAVRYVAAEASPTAEAESLCALWHRNLHFDSVAHAAEKLEHGYVCNPAGAGVLFAVRGATAASGETGARVAGSIGLHPRHLCIGERELVAASLADFAVDRSHRTVGPALMLMRAALRAGRQRFALVYGIPNADSHALLRRAGLKQIGEMQRFVLVISSRPKLEGRLPRAVLPLLAPFVDLALRARAFWQRPGLRSTLRCCEASFTDPAIDRVWGQRPRSWLMSDRAASTLRWRYARARPTKWRVAVARTADGRDAGYVAWRLDAGVAVVGDFLATHPSRETGALMHAFAQHARQAGAHAVTASFLGDPAVARGLLGAGFFPAGSPGEPVFVDRDGVLADFPDAQWYLTGYDNDGD